MSGKMEHKEFLESMQFYLYDEMDTNKKNTFEEHLNSCKDCSKEFKSFKNIFDSISNELDKDISQTLLHDARAELRGYIRASKKQIKDNYNFIDSIKSFFLKPAGLVFSGVTILFVGMFSGYLIFSSQNIKANAQEFENAQLKIQNINFIDSDPSDGQVEFTYDAVKPERIKGNINNPELQNILSYALLNEQNPGTRLNSINVINATNSSRMDEEIKQTFISVAKYDVNPGVRREALKALSETPADNDIKDALIYIILNDTSSGMRIEAINNLMTSSKKGIKLTQDDLTLLRNKMNIDNNNYVRLQAKNILKEY